MNIIGNYYIHLGELQSSQSLKINLDIKKKEIYEVIRIEDEIPLFLEDHLKRLEGSFNKLNQSIPFTKEKITSCIYELISKDDIKNNNFKISCLIDSFNRCEYYIYFIPSIYPNGEMYRQGISTVLLNAERTNPNIKIANSKVRSTANNQIQKQHVFEALLVNHNGLITEGSRTNLFFIINDVIYTAPSQLVLEGIIRSKVIEVINNAGYQLKMECIHASQLTNINAAFITGTSSRILPIKTIENQNLNVNHPLLKDLMQLLADKIEAYKNKKAGTN